MVRNYVRTPRSRKYRDYDENTLNKAIDEYRPGNLKQVSDKYSIPIATLYRRIKLV